MAKAEHRFNHEAEVGRRHNVDDAERGHGGSCLVASLAAHGVTHIFGVPGGQAAPMYAALAGQSVVRYVSMRDETSCGHAADAFARVTGRIAAIDATCGPGVLRLPAALGEALNSSIPILALGTAVPTASAHRVYRGAASQGVDQTAVLTPVVKRAFRVTHVNSIPNIIANAIRIAVSGRPGPVYVELPQDVLAAPSDRMSLPPACQVTFPSERCIAPAQALARAAHLLAESKRPLIIVGGGAVISGAAEEVERLAGALSAAVGTTLSGRDAVLDRFPMRLGVMGTIGVPGSRQLAERADVVVLIGFKFADNSTWGGLFPKADQHVIWIDVDDEQPSALPGIVRLIGDARDNISALCQHLMNLTSGDAVHDRSPWIDEVVAARTAWDKLRSEEEQPTPTAGPLRPQHVLSAVSANAGEHDAFVCDASFSSGWGALHLRHDSLHQRLLLPRGLAGLGYALPAAIGAALAGRHERVWCIAGDGAFSYTLGELSVLAALDLPVKCLVLNNQAYGWIHWWQAIAFDTGTDVARLPPIDFARIASGFGIRATSATDPGQLEHTLSEFARSEGPCVINVTTDVMQTPISGYRSALANRATGRASKTTGYHGS